MLWRTSPIGTELEGVVVGWLRQALGLPATFDGLLTDTASTSSLIALAAAREAAGLDAAAGGLAGRGRPRAAGLRLGGGPQLDREGVHDAGPRSGVGGQDPDQRRLRDGRRGAASGDRRRPRAGRTPVAIVATIGTTSSTSVDPVAAIADDRRARGPVAARRRRLRRGRRDPPGAARAVRGLGARRLDRRQPAQVAVHAARRVAAADAAGWTSCARRSASCPSTCGRSTGERPSSTTTSTSRSSGAGCAR